jgi:hypothetical protein
MTITLGRLATRCAAFWKNESRDAMYRIASKLVEGGWNKPAEVADGLGVVLLTCNNAAFRYGSFEFEALEDFLRTNKAGLDTFRKRHCDTSIAGPNGYAQLYER